MGHQGAKDACVKKVLSMQRNALKKNAALDEEDRAERTQQIEERADLGARQAAGGVVRALIC